MSSFDLVSKYNKDVEKIKFLDNLMDVVFIRPLYFLNNEKEKREVIEALNHLGGEDENELLLKIFELIEDFHKNN